jgi:hypothetical protein
MILITKTRLAVYIILAAVAGWYVCGEVCSEPGKPRPVVRLLQRAIRWGAFFWWISDEPPAGGATHVHPHDPADEHSQPVGADGFPLVDHRRAF